MPSSTSSRIYSEIACGVTPIFSAISCCRTAGWCSAISTRICRRETSRLLRKIEYRGSLAPGVKQHQSLPLHIHVGNPLRKPLDKDRADAEFPGEIVDRAVAFCKLPFDLLHDLAEVLVVGERDVEDIGKVGQVALEVGPELIVGCPELLLRLGSRFWHPPLLLHEISLLEDLETQRNAVIPDL